VSYLKTVLFLSGLTVIGWLLAPVLGYRSVGYIFLIGVLAIGSLASLGPVLFAAILSVFIWNYLFIPPKFTFAIAQGEDLFLCLTYFIAAIVTGVLTSQIRRNQEIARQADILRESEKLHQTLLNSISHELRTPLTAIMGAATALSDERAPTTKEFKQSLSFELGHATDRLNRVIENLLDMSRLSSGVLRLKKQWQDINDLVGVTLQRLGRNLNRHSIKIEIAPDVPLVEIDFQLFEHVLSNIILNATQYSPVNSTITIAVRVKNSNVLISIGDEGPGIPHAHLFQVFEKFYRIPGTPTGGTGLGLSIAKSIVELHQGELRAENRPEGGAQFIIKLPMGIPPEAPKERSATGSSH
jgi:two-component system sensor histidine kinase KdpD